VRKAIFIFSFLSCFSNLFENAFFGRQDMIVPALLNVIFIGMWTVFVFVLPATYFSLNLLILVQIISGLLKVLCYYWILGQRGGLTGTILLTVFSLAAVAALGDSLRASRNASGVAVSWDACSGAASYRVYRKASPTAAPSLVAETPSTSWSDPAVTIGYYQVRPVDACGTERPD
jgi:hypothetical protein